MTNLRERIIADVKSCKSTLSREQDVRNVLNYATRANGDVGNEEYAEEDYQDALRVGEYLLKQDYATKIKVSLDTVDEWVLLSIGIKEN